MLREWQCQRGRPPVIILVVVAVKVGDWVVQGSQEVDAIWGLVVLVLLLEVLEEDV